MHASRYVDQPRLPHDGSAFAGQGRIGKAIGTFVLGILSACAAPGSNDACNPGVTAIAGSILGGVTGAATARDRNNQGKRAAAGALIGGAVGGLACVAVNSSTRQVRTAAEVDTQARGLGRGSLPAQATVLTYHSRLEPAATARPGSQIIVRSSIEVANGAQEPVSNLKEVLILVDPQGEQYRLAQKAVGSTPTSAGRFENTFTFSMPRGVSQGTYQVVTQLHVNGRLAEVRNSKLQLV